MPDEAGLRNLRAFVIVHRIVAPRAVGAAAQRNAADNDDDLWLCADGCTHHSDHLSISLRAVLLHRPLMANENPYFKANLINWSDLLYTRAKRPAHRLYPLKLLVYLQDL